MKRPQGNEAKFKRTIGKNPLTGETTVDFTLQEERGMDQPPFVVRATRAGVQIIGTSPVYRSHGDTQALAKAIGEAMHEAKILREDGPRNNG